MTSTGHMSVPKGKRVIVHMRQGNAVIAKFWKNEGGKLVYFYDHEPIPKREIRTISIYKEDEK